MSAVVSRPSRLATVALAVAMPLGPLLIAVLRGVMPTFSAGDAASTAAAVAANPGRQSLSVWLGMAGMAVLVPGVLAAATLTREAAPKVTRWAVGLLVPAYIYLGFLVAGDAAAWSAQQSGIGPAAAASLLSHMHAAVGVGTAVFVAGHVLGTVLLGVALLKTRAVRPVFGWLVAVSQPMHFVGFVILNFRPLDVLAWTLTGAGMAAAAWTLLRAPDLASTAAAGRADLARATA